MPVKWRLMSNGSPLPTMPVEGRLLSIVIVIERLLLNINVMNAYCTSAWAPFAYVTSDVAPIVPVMECFLPMLLVMWRLLSIVPSFYCVRDGTRFA